jgi:hypothetical protein
MRFAGFGTAPGEKVNKRIESGLLNIRITPQIPFGIK